MPQRVDLDVDFIRALAVKGWTRQQLADRFKVSKVTIKRLLRDRDEKKEVLSFAAKVEALLSEVPDEYCRRELNRMINFLRTHSAMSRDDKQLMILSSLETGATELEEIVDDCDFQRSDITEEIKDLLDDLVKEGLVVKRVRGGRLNSGAAMKYNYVLAERKAA